MFNGFKREAGDAQTDFTSTPHFLTAELKNTWLEKASEDNDLRMKNLSWFLGLLVVVGLVGMGWFHFGVNSTRSSTNSSSPQQPFAHSISTPVANAAPSISITPEEYRKLCAVRDAVLKSNPELAAEYEQLKREQLIQQAQLDEATIKADPKVAPIVAKMVAQRQESFPKSPATPVTR